MPRSRAILLAWLAALAVCAAIAARATYVADLSSFLPAAPTAEQRVLVQQLRDGAVSRVMLMGIEGSDAAGRARLSRAFAAALRGDKRFALVANGEGAGFEREQALLLANRYVLSAQVSPQRFSVDGLRAAVGDTLDLLASPAGLLAKALVPRDPTGEMLAVIDQLRPSEGPATQEGTWASADGKRAILLARTRAAGSDLDAQADAVAAAERAFADARTKAGVDARLAMSGPGVFASRARAMVEHDVSRLSAASGLLVAALLLAVYRSGRALLLGLVPVVSGAAAGIAAVALGFGTVHGLTLGFGTTLIGEAVDYAIYFFVQGGSTRFWPTIRLGVVTSIAGFCALIFSGLPGLAQLGVYSIVGLIAAALVARYVLPTMLPAGFRVRDLTGAGDALLRGADRAHRLAWLVPVLVVAALVVLVPRHAVLWDRDIASLNPISSADRRIDGELRASLGASDARYLLAVRGNDLDGALAAAERAGAVLDKLVADGRLAGYESPARFLPSQATQRARQESLPDEATLRARLAEALRGMPLAPAKLEPFIADVARARTAPLLTREAIAGTALEAGLDGLAMQNADGRWIAFLGLRAASPGIDPRAVRTAAAALPEALLLDVKGELDRIYSGYFGRALAASAVGLVVIVAVLFSVLRSWRRLPRVMAPLLAGVLVVAAGYALAGVAMSLMHLVALLLVVAIGSNYALFFDRLAGAPREEAARTVASLALANLTTVASFGALSLSSIPVLSAIGTTVAVGAFATLLLSAIASRRGIISP